MDAGDSSERTFPAHHHRALLHRRRRSGRHDAGISARARRRRDVVLEKHADFFRDFRGDTVHPSTLQVMDELGLIDDFLKIRTSDCRKWTASSATARSGSPTSAG